MSDKKYSTILSWQKTYSFKLSKCFRFEWIPVFFWSTDHNKKFAWRLTQKNTHIFLRPKKIHADLLTPKKHRARKFSIQKIRRTPRHVHHEKSPRPPPGSKEPKYVNSNRFCFLSSRHKFLEKLSCKSAKPLIYYWLTGVITTECLFHWGKVVFPPNQNNTLWFPSLRNASFAKFFAEFVAEISKPLAVGGSSLHFLLLE